jgi:hypothetical protein
MKSEEMQNIKLAVEKISEKDISRKDVERLLQEIYSDGHLEELLKLINKV